MTEIARRVAAFDPGGTTGYALVDVIFDAHKVSFNPIRLMEIKTYYDFGKALQDIQLWPEVVVVVESFNLYKHKAMAQVGNTFPSVEWIGIIKYSLWALKDQPEPIMQTPAQKEAIDDIMLHNSFDPLPSSPHVRDALRHVMVWAYREAYGS